ncbi:MATE family efflux transporter [Rhodoferax sp. AJA081-3]|uniref:MATE family efflux transporter n=1 Tax=Rhodoferax sp. AJA081-3 TaxID=2752316 RepID=UPI001AE0DFBA|nr:MATE family efflux transporter [Rhodoferax sp. AJA081-3]QTN27578.1 MATE family efflux transporter [Rhodoferax sp. AJA081-3]
MIDTPNTTAIPPTHASYFASLRDSFSRILPMAWPVLVGQLAVLGFSTVDTILVARFAASDLAALSIGIAAYITIFIGFMGMVLAISPMAGQLFGAGKLQAAGQQVHQAIWLALGLAMVGSTLLLLPGPFLALAKTSPEISDKVRGYLAALAFSLPASLLFTVYRGFNTAVSRPKAVMAVQIGGLAVKIPLSALFIYGWTLPLPGGLGTWQVSPMGVVGCGLATALVMWAQALSAWVIMRRDPFYAPFGLHAKGFSRPNFTAIRAQLKLGIPMGAAIMIEVTGFSSMAFLIARHSGEAVAGHQLAVNLVSMMFMVPLALANGTATLVAQRVGAHDHAEARRLGWHGVEIGVGIAAVIGALVYLLREPVLHLYTDNPTIIASALPLLVWVWWFHVADAAQTMANFVLRSHRVTLMPLVIYVTSLWGVGLLGGYWVTTSRWAPPALQGAQGYWAMSTAGLVAAGVSLCALLAWVHRQESPFGGTVMSKNSL